MSRASSTIRTEVALSSSDPGTPPDGRVQRDDPEINDASGIVMIVARPLSDRERDGPDSGEYGGGRSGRQRPRTRAQVPKPHDRERVVARDDAPGRL